MATLELAGLTKRYGRSAAVDDISLTVPDGQLLALLGPSGCGKTTTLRMVAGLIRPDAGTVRLGGRDITALPPERRDIGLVFQSYALFPHKTVAENIAFGLRMRGLRSRAYRPRVAEMLERMRLSELGDRMPAQLSGGQRQRVALGRALVCRPGLLLLDEPLSNLDANLREEMRFHVRELVTEFGITTVYVTHDQAEALALADSVAVVMDGAIAQLGPPEQVYTRPERRAVASFIGVTNILAGEVGATGAGTVEVAGAWGRVEAAGAIASPTAAVSVRPEDIALAAAPAGAEPTPWSTAGGTNRAVGVVAQRAYLGALIEYRVSTGAGCSIRIQAGPHQRFAVGDRIHLRFDAQSAWTVADTELAPADRGDLAGVG